MDSQDPAARLADELRGAIEELSSRTLEADQLEQAVVLAAELRTLLDGPRAPRWYDAGIVEGRLDGTSAESVFERQSLFHGAHNPLAPPMTLDFVETERGPTVQARVTLGLAYEGPPHGVHGGYVAGMFDDILGATQRLRDKPGVTGRISIDYRHITPIEEELTFHAWIEEDVGRRLVAKATCHAGDTLTAEGEALFITVDFDEVQARMAARREPAGD
jgi:acyl-coenzyme A thioesterase PaaI-like protein